MEENVPALPPSAGSGLLREGSAEQLSRVVALLERNHLFQRCSRDQLDFLAATAYPMRFEAGDLLCIEGTYAPVCYVVAEGHAEVTIGRDFVGEVDANDVVGERGILLETARAATVTATGHMVTFAIPRERLQTLLGDSRSVRDWMLQDVQQHYAAPR